MPLYHCKIYRKKHLLPKKVYAKIDIEAKDGIELKKRLREYIQEAVDSGEMKPYDDYQAEGY